MVLYCFKWNVHPDKVESYPTWAQSAIRRTLAAGGVTEFRGYRPASGAFEVVVTYEFADMAAWATWYHRDNVQQVIAELRTIANNIAIDLWGPSPIVPQPIRPAR